MEFLTRSHLIRRLGALLVVACCLFPKITSGQSTAADPALDEYNLAIGLYKQKRWALAADSFRKFVASRPKHARTPYARLYLGLTLVNLEDHKGAREVLRKYIADYPQSRELPHAMYRVAECSYFLDDLPASEKEFQAFLAKCHDDPLREYAYPYLADAQLRMNKPQEALASFQKSLEVAPQGKLAEDSRFGMARAYEALKKNGDAVKLYQQIASNRTGTRAPEAHFRAATLTFDAGDLKASAQAYDQLESLFPASHLIPLARLNAGYAYYRLKEYATAAERFSTARKDASLALTAGYWLALSLKAQSQYDKAMEAFSALDTTKATPDVAEGIQFQWADCQLRLAMYAPAEQRFRSVADRWPKGQFAAESLLFAAEALLLDGKTDGVDTLLDRFQREFPKSGLRLYETLLRGRWYAARGGDEDLKRAVEFLSKVASESTIPRTQAQARLHLARVQLDRKEYGLAIEALNPLVDQIANDATLAEFAEAWVLQAQAALSANEYDLAVKQTTQYLTQFLNGPYAEQALSVRALAEGHRGNAEAVQRDLQAMAKQFPESLQTARLTLQIAEMAYSEKKWEWASKLFTMLLKTEPTDINPAAVLSGLAWSLYHNKNHRQAAEYCAQLVSNYPADVLAPQAAYLRGIALRDAGDLDSALPAFQETTKAYTGTWEGYEAARESARTLKQLGRIPEADAAYKNAYDELRKQPPEKQDKLDAFLDEWALVNYEAGRYKRSDEIFQALLKDMPASPLADNARFSLAESDLVSGKLDAAQNVFQSLANDSNSDEDVRQDSLFRLMEIASERQQWKKSLEHATSLEKQFPEGKHRWDALFHRAQAALHLGDFEDATKSLAALKEQRDNPDVSGANWFPHVWALLAEAHFHQKRYQQIESLSSEFDTSFPASPIRYRLDDVLGRAYKRQSRFEEARTSLTRVVQSETGRRTETAAQSQLMIAETYFLQKNYQTALTEYLKVYHLYSFPEWQAAGLFQAALCDELLDHWPDAARSYELLLKEFPKSELAEKAQSRLEVAKKRANN